ncbi:MAG: DUF2779 domain-containing protein [Vicinamibacterales bacterium]
MADPAPRARGTAQRHPYDRSGDPGALSSVRFPVHFLDFETFSPAIPIYVGTHPYDPIPFQWSDHVLRRSVCPGWFRTAERCRRS